MEIKENYQYWIDAVCVAWSKGWICQNGWVFISPSGSSHDLSAADLTKLDHIERHNLFSV